MCLNDSNDCIVHSYSQGFQKKLRNLWQPRMSNIFWNLSGWTLVTAKDVKTFFFDQTFFSTKLFFLRVEIVSLNFLEKFSKCFRCSAVVTKLRQLGFQNQIVDDSWSDSNELGQQLYNNLDFIVKIWLSLSFTIYLRSFLIKFDQIQSIFNLFLIKIWLNVN